MANPSPHIIRGIDRNVQDVFPRIENDTIIIFYPVWNLQLRYNKREFLIVKIFRVG